jgi:hypothetical protein
MWRGMQKKTTEIGSELRQKIVTYPSLNISNFRFGKSHIKPENKVTNKDQLARRLQEEDKRVLLEACKDTLAWLDTYSASATIKEFEDQRERLPQCCVSRCYKAIQRARDHGGL